MDEIQTKIAAMPQALFETMIDRFISVFTENEDYEMIDWLLAEQRLRSNNH